MKELYESPVLTLIGLASAERIASSDIDFDALLAGKSQEITGVSGDGEEYGDIDVPASFKVSL